MRVRPELARVLAVVVVAAATFACFAPTVGFELLRYHDGGVVASAGERGLGPDAVVTLLSEARSHPAPPPFYQPLTAISVTLDTRAWDVDARGYHLTNVLLHTLNAVLAYLLIVALIAAARGGTPGNAGRAAAAAAALAWSLHPLRAEPVAWLSARSVVLSTTFALGAVLAYVRAAATRPDDPPPTGWWAASVVLAGLAMAASAAAAVLPLVLLVLDAYPLRRVGRTAAGRLAGEKLGYVAIPALVLLIALREPAAPPTDVPFSSRLGQAVFGLCFYGWKSVVPLGLSPMYELMAPLDPTSPELLGGAAAVLAVTLALLLAARRWPAGLATWTAYVVLVLPYLGFAWQGPEIAADRYAYAATLPFAALLGGGLDVLGGRLRQRVARAAAAFAVVATLALLAFLTTTQAARWSSTMVLWTTTAEREPDNLFVQLATAQMLQDENLLGLAVPHYDAILAMADARGLPPQRRADVTRPLIDGLNRLGHTALYEGNPQQALAHFQRALALDPADHRMRLNVGAVHLQLGRLDEAIAELDQALAVDPSDERTLNAMALALMQAKRLEEAEQRLRQAVAVAPDNAITRTNLGAVLRKLGRVDEAIHEWEEALRIDPDLAPARKNLEHWQRAAGEQADGDAPAR
jgi:tetratricopeptide (TPR) repeat protein